jgi:hypothetical protein
MIRVDGHSCYCCEQCNDSYAYVHIREDGKPLWVSSYIDTDAELVAELRDEVTEECLKRGIDISKIEYFDDDYVGDWEYKECLDLQT